MNHETDSFEMERILINQLEKRKEKKKRILIDNYYGISGLNSTDCNDVEGLKDKKQEIRGDRG